MTNIHEPLSASTWVLDLTVVVVMALIIMSIVWGHNRPTPVIESTPESIEEVNETSAPIYTIPDQCDLAVVDCK